MIYQGASLFVYPSIFEGFGIPVIEALYSGIPVITSTGSCFKEAGGPGTIYVSPFDTEEMAHQIDRALEDNEMRKKMIETGNEFVSKFHINQVVDRTWEVYKSMK
jgi:glycosyltransferase involved in cell wall biosynthesis